MAEQALVPGFMVVHGNRPELLRQLLIAWMRAHPLAPLEDEVILIQSNGIAQWLKLALAADATGDADAGCGIAAGIATVLPSRFIWQAYRAVLGAAAVPDASPFDKPLLTWRLMRLLPALVGEPGFAPLAGFLADDPDLRKRYQLAERLADLFDQYQVYRADWLAAWSAGDDVLTDDRGGSQPLGASSAWQPRLWRALTADIGADGAISRAAVHRRFMDAAATLAGRPTGLPRRVIVFGLSSLPRQSLEALAAIARWTQVLLCVNNPCQHDWGNIVSQQDFARRTRSRPVPHTAGATPAEALHLNTHPLLAAWGKQGRDYIALLDAFDDAAAYRQHFADIGQRIDLFESNGNACLLNQLQEDIRELRSAGETAWPPVDPDTDHSLRFHIAHSVQREVEILNDALLAAFAGNPALRPRDIIVMVPDIDRYAPHIQAVFGRIETADARFIPFSIADQGRRHETPIAEALAMLLGLDETRLAASDVLDLLEVPALRRRFGIGEADLPLLQQWIRGANIRWGLDEGHRASLGLAAAGSQNTWHFGLRRILLGYAAGADAAGDNDWHGIEPFADVAGLDAALAGPLANLIDRLATLRNELLQEAGPGEWGRRLHRLIADFFVPEEADESLLVLRMQSALDDWVAACRDAELETPLPLAVVREHWLKQIDAGALSRRFFAGRLIFATLMPMRAIPFRMVCLLGMNDGDYPRTRTPADFDLMARDHRPGDRSRREDDRYLFLEALLSARERLHISWVGRDIRDNSERPPSVLVSQLRDHIAACWKLPGTGRGGDALVAALTVEHRLQPFNPAYFGHDANALFTYAREWQPGPVSAPAPERSANAPLAAPVFDTPLTLGKLAAFLKDPVKTFFRERLSVFYESDDPTAADQEPFAIDALEQWAIQDDLIRTRLDALERGVSEAEAVAARLGSLRLAGGLPGGAAGGLLQPDLLAPLDELFNELARVRADWPETLVDEEIDFIDPTRAGAPAIRDRLSGLRTRADGARCRILPVSRNLLDGKHYRHDRMIAAWIDHLAGHLGGTGLQTILVGKNGTVRIAALDPEAARGHFADLVDAFVDGLCRPLPLAPCTGLAWLRKGDAGEARRAYEGDDYQNDGERGGNPYLLRVFPTFAALLYDGEFSQLAETLLRPLAMAVGARAGGGEHEAEAP